MKSDVGSKLGAVSTGAGSPIVENRIWNFMCSTDMIMSVLVRIYLIELDLFYFAVGSGV
jgi:hypothetical protein